jgi:hypothetical protein
MAHKLREPIMTAIRERSLAFSTSTFPQTREEWTPEQKAVFEYLNGSSGGITAVHESHRPEITKNLVKYMNLEGLMKSRFLMTDYVKVPPYTIIVLEQDMGPFPAGYPILKSRIEGYWTEKGTGASDSMAVRLNQIRPVTEDDIRRFTDKFPDTQLKKLWGALPLNEKKFRKAIEKVILEKTETFALNNSAMFPEGITDKGRAILSLGMDSTYVKALSIILEDDKMLEDYKMAPMIANFVPYAAVTLLHDMIGSSYHEGRAHVNALSDVFFTWPDEDDDVIGNHHEPRNKNIRPSTPEEITEYVKQIPADRLHLYVEALTEDQIVALL